MATSERHFNEDRSRSPRTVRRLTALESPPRGLPLGLSLGLILALAVSLVLGLLTGIDQHRELVMEQSMREARLAARLASLGADLESVSDPAALPAMVAHIRHTAEALTGDAHGLELDDLAGHRVAVAAPGGELRPPPGSLQASTEIRCPALDDGSGRLVAWQDGAALMADRTRLWRDWVFDLVLTSLAVILAVELAVHLLVGRPLGRLVGGLRRLGQGHIGPLDPGPGAWEIRWLAWRFEQLGRELSDNARRLVAAERRARDATRSLVTTDPPAGPDDSAVSGARRGAEEPRPSTSKVLAHRYLEDGCRLLERLRADDSFAHEIAEEAWSKAVLEAERLGDVALKARFEDAALRILEPQAFAELDAELAALRQRRRQWLKWVSERLAEVLQSDRVPVRQIQHRVKHTAGVWRKMREAQLAVDQVHDLFAFRVIVPTDGDCYLALAAVHDAFEPEPFRFKDYVEFPKPNGYRSLHTSVRDSEGRLFEVQIRTTDMHASAENGHAAHWRYRDERWGSMVSIHHPASWRRPLRALRELAGRLGARTHDTNKRRPTAGV